MASLRVFLRGYKYFRVCGIAFRVRVSGLETDSDLEMLASKRGCLGLDRLALLLQGSRVSGVSGS